MEKMPDKPLVVTHENSMLYASLKQCMTTNSELREALIDAAETISTLTDMLNKIKNETKNT